MALIICPECGKEISDKAEKCSGCGCPIKHKKSKSAKKIGKGTIIGGLLGIVVFVIVVIVLVLFLLKDSDDTPLKKAEKFYHSGDYTSYSELKLSETEIKKFNLFLEKQIDEIYQKYFDEEMSYEDAIRQIEATEQYSDSLSNLSSIKSNINELNHSRNAFNEAQTKEDSEKYVDAYKDYKKVIEDDPNYGVAQEKIVDLATKVIVEYKQLAANAANENNYTSAISYIDAALNIDSTNDELINLKNEYTIAREVKVAQEVEAARLEKLINVGDSFNTTNYSITLEDARLTREVHPNNSGRAHLYYSCSDNNSIWFDLVFRIKNISVDSRELESFISNVKATYNTSYTYTAYSSFVSNSDDIDKVYSWDRLAALGETTFHVCIVMPLEVKSTDYPISIEFTLDGIDKILDYR